MAIQHFYTLQGTQGKATILLKNDGRVQLMSYSTTVAEVRGDVLEVFGDHTGKIHSATTLKHIKAFIEDQGFPSGTKKFIEQNYMKGGKKYGDFN
jgi:hypothetical protein